MEIFNIHGIIDINNDEANNAIKETAENAKKSAGEATNSANSAHLKIAKIMGGIGKVIKTAAKVTAVAVGATGTAFGVLGKAAVDNYANYEQLVGGVETLFKGSSKEVVDYAKEAYKTAGMSANEYMETVTGFSASLLQSLGGDTEKACKKANQAVIDMSDNANKMGSSMESIQNAYQGFAKQNYTMLDNLKLGYGGTKEEMQRLLSDAEKISGIKYDISSYADVVGAIHVMQESMGIAGTTSKEAATTIQGSIGMMKSAWTNFLTGMADENQDFDQLCDNLIDSVVTVGENIIPRIQELTPRIINGISKIAAALIPAIPPIIQTLLPAIIQGSVALISGIISVLPQIATAVASAVPMILQSLIQQGPSLLSAGGNLISMIVDGVVKNGPKMIDSAVNTASDFINGMSKGLVQGIPNFLSNALPMIEQFTGQLRQNAGKMVDAGLNLVTDLVQGIINSIPVLVSNIPQIVINIAGIINDNAPKMLITAGNLILQLALGLIRAIPTIVKNIPKIIKAMVAVFTAFNWLNLGKTIIKGLANGIKNMVGTVKTASTSIKEGIVNAIKNLPSNLKMIATNAMTNIKNAFTSANLKNVATNVMNSVKNAFGNIMNGAFDVVKGVIDKIKGVFNFSWSLPNLKLPHLSVTGGVAPFGIGGKGSLPSFDIKWYRKAMESPVMFSKPTVFDMNPLTGQARGAGEAGDEMMYGHQNLMDDIQTAVSNAQGKDTTKILADILVTLQAIKNGMYDTIVKALQTMGVKFDERELARLVKKYAL